MQSHLLTAFVSSGPAAAARQAAMAGEAPAMDWLVWVAATSVLVSCTVMLAAGFLKGCR